MCAFRKSVAGAVCDCCFCWLNINCLVKRFRLPHFCASFFPSQFHKRLWICGRHIRVDFNLQCIIAACSWNSIRKFDHLVILKSVEYPSRAQYQWSCKIKCHDEKNKVLASPCKNKEWSKAFKNANHPYQIRNEKIQVISSARNKNQLSAVPLRNAQNHRIAWIKFKSSQDNFNETETFVCKE